MGGRDESLCELGSAEVVGPAKEQGEGDAEYQKKDGEGSGSHGEGWRVCRGGSEDG